MKKVNWITLIVGLGFLLFATGLILGGYFINKSHSDFMDTAVATEATIVDIKEEIEYDRLDEEYDTEQTRADLLACRNAFQEEVERRKDSHEHTCVKERCAFGTYGVIRTEVYL